MAVGVGSSRTWKVRHLRQSTIHNSRLYLLPELKTLGRDHSDEVARYCRSKADGPIGRCGAALQQQLQTIMTTCPCHGPKNKAVAEQLRDTFGDRDAETRWVERCESPGMPGACD